MITNPPIPTVDRFRRLDSWQSTDIGQVGGTGIALASNTVYQATTDGFVCAEASNTTSSIIGKTNSINPPTVVRNGNGENTAMSNRGICMPVKKGDYWLVLNSQVLYFMPLILGTAE